MARMLNDKPIRQCRIHYRCPVHVFTDGAAEPDQPATAGAMYIDPESGTRQFLAYEVPHDLISKWVSGDRTQAINQVELHPVSVAINTWQTLLSGRDVVFWIDNESARHGIIRGTSPVPDSSEIIEHIWQKRSDSEVFPWFARVPSAGNPADDPSRMVIDKLVAEGWPRVKPIF